MVQEASPSTQELPTPTETLEAQATSVEEAAAQPVLAGEEGEKPGPEEAPPAWASIRDPYDLLEHDEVKPYLERRDRRIQEGLTAEYQGKLEAATKEWESTNLHQSLAGYVGRITDLLGGLTPDVEGADRLLGRLESLAKPFEETYRDTFRNEGRNNALGGVLAVFKDGLDLRRQDEIEDMVRNPRTTWGDLLKQRIKMGAEKERETGRKEGREEGRKAALEDIAARERGNPDRNPDMTPKTPAGGKSYSQMTREERSKLTPQEIDRLVVQELGG